jgi:myo-inositol 2-dehydrogenase/D-chiro-inositol 1-dehydrogenase
MVFIQEGSYAMATDHPLEIAIVGAGRMGSAHIRALRSSKTVRVVAASDPDPAARDRIEAQGLRAHANLEAMIGAGGFDAALVASPTDSHLDAVHVLSTAGVPTLCEKPCGLSAAEALEAGRMAAEADVPLQIGYWRRFVPSLRALHDEIRGDAFGAVQWVHCFHWDERPPPAAFRVRSGGIVIDMGVHEVDMTRWLTGEDVVEAFGAAASVGIDPPVAGDPESASFLARLSGGGLLSATLGRRFPPGDGCRVQVVGLEKAADVSFVWPPDGDRAFEEALRAQAEAFASWVAGGPCLGATAEDAAAALLAAAMVVDSLDNGAEIGE